MNGAVNGISGIDVDNGNPVAKLKKFLDKYNTAVTNAASGKQVVGSIFTDYFKPSNASVIASEFK